MLHGRAGESAAIEQLVADARRGRSGVLILRGEAGIGKTALLEHARTVAADLRVLRGCGIESERELPFAGLHLLLRGHLDGIDKLPAQQASALRAALGMAAGSGGDRFLVGLAVLTLLADLAEPGPVLCVVDDAHWLDHASAEVLLFVARRLHAEGIAVLLAVRDEPASTFPVSGLAELRLDGLDGEAAASLLGERAPDLPRHIRTRILDEARGNPLALLELPAMQQDGRLTDRGHIGRIQQTFAHQISLLPAATQKLLAVAAAEDSGNPAVVFAAAQRLGVSMEALEPAERAHLAHFAEGRLSFRHPLVRATAYQSAPLTLRVEAHRALAETFDGATDSDRRAWHLAAISAGPDEHVAAMLEGSAERARARGGFAAMAAACERAAALSPDPEHRGRRLLAAAEASEDAGRLGDAGDQAARAADFITDPVALARAASVRATVADEQHRSRSAHRILTDAGLAAAGNPDAAGYLLFRAVDSAIVAGDPALIRETAARTAQHVPEGGQALALARMAIGFGSEDSDEIADGVRALRELIGITEWQVGALKLRETALVPSWYWALGDDTGGLELADRLVRHCREQGAVGVLPLALCALSRFESSVGRQYDALANATEGLRIAHDTGHGMSAIYLTSVLADIAAARGDADRCRELIADCRSRSPELGPVLTAGASSLLDLGLGRYEAVLAGQPVIEAGANRSFTLFALPNIVEAAARSGQPERAATAHRWFATWAAHTGHIWAAAVSMRCTALLAEDAEPHFTRAVELHRGGGRPLEQARTQLLFGEWLRRDHRRTDARGQLRAALEIFDRLDATALADRARSELRAAGESGLAQRPVSDAIGLLTPQELQVVRLAATGLSNRGIGAQLFLSPRTVGYHLSNAYPKLGVASRTELPGLDLAP